MATSGAEIRQANFSTSWAKSYTAPKTSTVDQNHYLYMCSPCWIVVATCDYRAFGGSGVIQLAFSYFNGTSWTDLSRNEVSGKNGNVTRRFCFNRDEGNTTVALHNTSTSPLWRLRYWTSRSNTRWNIDVFLGSWGMAVDTSGNPINYPIGKKIFSRGRTGDPIHDAGTTESNDCVVNTIFNSTNRKGSLVLASDDSELISIPWKE